MSGVSPERMRARASAIVGGRRARAVFVVTLGLGILAIVLSEKHSHHSTFWGIVGVVGFVLVIVSLFAVDTCLVGVARAASRRAYIRGAKGAAGGSIGGTSATPDSCSRRLAHLTKLSSVRLTIARHSRRRAEAQGIR